MCKHARIAPQLFGLFVRTEIYRRYAERFMQAQQIDEVDDRTVLSKAGLLDKAPTGLGIFLPK